MKLDDQNFIKNQLIKFLQEYFPDDVLPNNFILQDVIKSSDEANIFILKLNITFNITIQIKNLDLFFIDYYFYNILFTILIITAIYCLIIDISVETVNELNPYIAILMCGSKTFIIEIIILILSINKPTQNYLQKHISTKIIKQKKVPIKFDDLYQAILNNKWEDPKHEKIKI